MCTLIGLFCILLSVIFYRLTRRFSDPMVVVTSSWGVSMFLYTVVEHGMTSLSSKVSIIFFLWIVCFLIGVSFFNYHKSKRMITIQKILRFDDFYDIKNNTVVRKNLNVFFWISLLCFFPQVYLSYMQGISGGGNFFLNMRLASAGLIKTEYNVGIFGYGKTFTIVTLLAHLLIYKIGYPKKRIYILFFMYFILSILAVGKSQFLFLIISMMLVWSFKKKISKKTILIGFVSLVLIFSMLQLARSTEDDNTSSAVVSEMFYGYFFAGMPALDLISNSEMESSEFGQNSLQFFKRFIDAFGETSEKTEETYTYDITNGGYVYVPDATNVYTIIGPFWLDFKYYGVVIFGFIYGVLFGFLYKKSIQMHVYGIITYCLFVSSLILPFFGEFIFAYLSYFLQVLLISYLVDKPFLRFLHPKIYSL